MPLGTNSPAELIGVIFSPTDRPGSLSKLQSAARTISCALNARQVHDRVVDRPVDIGRHLGVGDLVGRCPQLVRLHRDVIELVQGAAHGLVAVGADVVDDPTDGGLEIGVEDGLQTPCDTGRGGPPSSIVDQVIERSTDMSDEGIG